ncbi:MAG: hypothetical protein MJ120_01810 [Clostridia bacterium]|nr:hypothetical protein [Clostridia bacterium]
MTKKRFITITAVYTILLLIVSGTFMFRICERTRVGKYFNASCFVSNDLCNYIKTSENLYSDEARDRLTWLTRNRDINVVYALMDSDGKLISKSSPYISFEIPADDHFDFRIIELEPYLTDEILEQTRKSGKTTVKSVSVHKNGDTLIPVEAELYGSDDDYDEPLKIRFTDYTPDFTATEENNSACLYFFGENTDKVNNKYFNNMCKHLDSFISDFSQKYSPEEIESDEPIHERLHDRDYCMEEIKLKNRDADGKEHNVILYYEYYNNLEYDVLTSTDFGFHFLITAAVFLIAGLGICIVGTKLIKKIAE